MPAEAILDFDAQYDLELDRWPRLEAQVAALADDIAYNNHDIDDGCRAGLFTLDELAEVPLAGRAALPRCERPIPASTAAGALRGDAPPDRRLVDDVIAETRRRPTPCHPISADDVRHAGRPWSPSRRPWPRTSTLRAFLSSACTASRVERVMEDAERIVADLFDRYRADPTRCPPNGATRRRPNSQARDVCDFIAGMTDRYALEEHRRLFDHTPDLR